MKLAQYKVTIHVDDSLTNGQIGACLVALDELDLSWRIESLVNTLIDTRKALQIDHSVTVSDE